MDVYEIIPIFTALICGWSFFQSSDIKMKWGLLAVNSILVVYSYTQGLYFGAAVFLLASLRTVITIYSRHWVIALGLIGAHIALPFIIIGDDLLSIVAGVISVAAFFLLDHWKLRLSQALVSSIWAVNALLFDAYGLMAQEVILAGICYGMAAKLYITGHDKN